MGRRTTPVTFHRPVVWVTGASRGIGREIALQFASIGCRVCLSARTTRDVLALEKEITKLGGRAYAFPCDIAHAASVASAARSIARRIGRVEVLVNNAGITVFKSFLTTTHAEFDSILRTNLLGQIAAIRAVLPAMCRARGGWIVNILSTAARKTFEGSAAYTASKAGLHGLSKVLREEVRKYNINVVDILPGPTVTSMWSPASRRKYAPRMMSARSVAEAVLSLYRLPSDVVPEELVLLPMRGDIA